MATKKSSSSTKKTTKKATSNKSNSKTKTQKKRNTNNNTKNNSRTKANSKPKIEVKELKGDEAVRIREKRRFWSYVLLFYGVFELCLTFIKGDGLWKALYEINRGIFGMSVFLFAPFIIYIAILISLDKSKNSITAKVVESIVLMFLLSASAQIFLEGKIYGSGFLEKLTRLYADGVELKGGGLAGGLIGWPLLASFKKVGAAIIIVILLMLFIMLLTNVTIPQVFKFITKPFVSGVKAVNEDRVERAKNRPAKQGDKDVRVDIAKFLDEDATSVNIKNQPAQNDDYFAQDKQTQKEELEKIAKKAVSKKKFEPKKEEQEEQEIFIDNNEQATWFENENLAPQYVYPPIDILKPASNAVPEDVAQQEILEKSEKLVETLETFGVKTRIIGIHRGPSVTRYELQPAAGVKVKQITNLADDIALNLAANGVRIEAPIPGKAAIGIEIPNNHRDSVSMRELIDSDDYRNAKGKLTFAVGKDIEGKIVIGDISSMPHMLIAGTTGSGKSVFTNSIILNILFHATPDEVKLILIDPKKVEFPMYNGIPHLLIPVVTEPLKAAGALGYAVNEMMRRYNLFEANGTKNIEDYNQFVDENPDLDRKKMPQILIVVDEFADLMLAAKSEVEESVMRLAQLARAAGIHMIIATQSPRVDVLTGLIKANIPSRTALSVANNTDSRVILDEVGAEKLLGKGDMLYKPVGLPKPLRIQSGFASTSEIRNLVSFLKNEHKTEYSEEVIHEVEKNIPQPKNSGGNGDDVKVNPDDDLTNQAITLIVETGNASTAFLQRKLKLGFPRAARIMDEIEEMGIIGPQEGSKPRKINMTKEEWYERQALN